MKLLAQASAHALPLRSESVQCVVCSPPYWGLRSYSGEQSFAWPDGWYGSLGLEPTPELYVEHMVEIFREVRRVLRSDGVVFLNLGDCYATGAGSYRNPGSDVKPIEHGGKQAYTRDYARAQPNRMPLPGLKPKDLVGIPWRVAFALQADGWWLRSDIVWAKPNPMPESVRDRPTKSHEYLFLLTKSARYFYDSDAIRESGTSGPSDLRKMAEQRDRIGGRSLDDDDPLHKANRHTNIGQKRGVGTPGSRNARSVWHITTAPYAGAHFAAFPEALVEPCVKAGSAQQACAECGAPWERTVELIGGETTGRTATQESECDQRDIERASYPANALNDVTAEHHTTGFQPTCEHDDGSGQSVVLDPFCGTSTVGRVALRLGRSYVGLDLSREYLAEHSVERLRGVVTAVQEPLM